MWSYGEGIVILEGKAAMRKRPGMYFSFCETVHAMGPWHLRQHPMGVVHKYGGGADTPTLCGLKAAWDIRAPVTTENIMRESTEPGRTCSTCREKFLEMTSDGTT